MFAMHVQCPLTGPVHTVCGGQQVGAGGPSARREAATAVTQQLPSGRDLFFLQRH
jgi:hypothetical protein